MNRNTTRDLDVLAPLLADFQLLGDGIDRLAALLRPASTPTLTPIG